MNLCLLGGDNKDGDSSWVYVATAMAGDVPARLLQLLTLNTVARVYMFSVIISVAHCPVT